MIAQDIIAICGALSLCGLIISAAGMGLGVIWDSHTAFKIAVSLAAICAPVFIVALILTPK